MESNKEIRYSVFAVCNFFTMKLGKIHPIGGKVNRNEGIIEAFIREFWEESGYKLKESNISLAFTNILDVDSIPQIWHQHFFDVKGIDYNDLIPSNEVEEIVIVSPYELLNMDDDLLTFASVAIKKHYNRIIILSDHIKNINL